MKASERLFEFGRARAIGEIALVLYLVVIVAALLLLLIRPNLGPLRLAAAAEFSAKPAKGALVEMDLESGGGGGSTSPDASTAIDQSDATAEGLALKRAGTDVGTNTRLPSPNAESGAAERSFIPLDFSLPPGNTDNGTLTAAPEGSIRVRKAVHVGSKPVGSLQITIDRNSRLLLDVRDLRKLMRDRPLPDGLPADGLVSFRMLRDLGVNLRYNPTEDLVSLETN
ncbi:hypothetical protein ACXYL9_13280 [Qipengyuania sp. CAU 1752]